MISLINFRFEKLLSKVIKNHQSEISPCLCSSPFYLSIVLIAVAFGSSFCLSLLPSSDGADDPIGYRSNVRWSISLVGTGRASRTRTSVLESRRLLGLLLLLVCLLSWLLGLLFFGWWVLQEDQRLILRDSQGYNHELIPFSGLLSSHRHADLFNHTSLTLEEFPL